MLGGLAAASFAKLCDLAMAEHARWVARAPLVGPRDPGLVGPLMLAALAGRWASGLIMPEPLHHALSRRWRRSAAGH